jgi:hypothetical protein
MESVFAPEDLQFHAGFTLQNYTSGLWCAEFGQYGGGVYSGGTMEYPTLKECKRYNAKVLPKFCENCQAIAQQVFLLLVAFPENKVKISDIANTDIDRFVTCGDCSLCYVR